jgi:IS30 family transposase
MGQGKRFSEKEVVRIKQLLADTDMSIPEIATRMHCCQSTIASLNRQFDIRRYNGRRTHWTDLLPAPQAVRM